LKEQGEEFDLLQNELLGLKIVCFTNLVVCKFKGKEFQSVCGITDQILEMDPNHVKALWFRGRAECELGDLGQSIKTLEKLCALDNSAEFRKELDRAKKVRLNEQ
jgi:tetratricopeptide (TPR) repeat protein